MSDKTRLPVGREAIDEFGWLRAHRFLLLRRLSQLFFLLSKLELTLFLNLFIKSPSIDTDTSMLCIHKSFRSV